MKLPLGGCALVLVACSAAPELGAQPRGVRPSPAFNAERPAALPGEEWITNGRNEMPAFGAAMSQEDIQDLASYMLEELLKP